MAPLRAILLIAALAFAAVSPALAQGQGYGPGPAQGPGYGPGPGQGPAQGPGRQQPPGGTYSSNEILDAGHRFFGVVSRDLALVIEKAVGQWGQPNGYILGQEASAAITLGLRYGEGALYTRNAGSRKIFWQGPSLGFDLGGDGARTMMLVYNLQSVDEIYKRFAGLSGSAYFVGGFGMTALTAGNSVVVPIRSGLGMRLGANIGYLKFTDQATWNPF